MPCRAALCNQPGLAWFGFASRLEHKQREQLDAVTFTKQQKHCHGCVIVLVLTLARHTFRLLSILESMMSWVWLALVRALNVRKMGTISAGNDDVNCCVTFSVLPAGVRYHIESSGPN